MSSMQFNHEAHQATVNPDFDGERAKATGVFLLDIFTPGVSTPADLDPHSWEQVTRPVAPDVFPEVMQRICRQAGITLEMPS